jgi:hypothetical protein
MSMRSDSNGASVRATGCMILELPWTNQNVKIKVPLGNFMCWWGMGIATIERI